MLDRPRRIMALLASSAVAGGLPAAADAGGWHHKGHRQYLAVPLGTVGVAQALPVQLALPQVQTVQLAVPQVQTLQLAVPQVQTAQLAVPQVQTVQMAVPQPQAAPPALRLEIVEAVPRQSIPSPQAATPQQAAPQQAMPQQSAPAPVAASGIAAGQAYQLIPIPRHRCHLFCKH